MNTPTVLILGGKDKGNDYSVLKDLVKQKCIGLVYLGADNKKLHDTSIASVFLFVTRTL